jgi:Mg/Co/Ni transporter MgtE
MGIWRNIGKIVILLFQIVHEQVKWYIGSRSRVKRVSPIVPSHSNNKRADILDEISRIKKDEILKRYNEEQENLQVVHERPHYNIKPE